MSTGDITKSLFLPPRENDIRLRLASLLSENALGYALALLYTRPAGPIDPLIAVIHLFTARLLPHEHGLSA